MRKVLTNKIGAIKIYLKAGLHLFVNLFIIVIWFKKKTFSCAKPQLCFLQDLLDDPALVADVLQKGYEKNIVSTSDVALTLMTSCYGNCFITDNNHSVLKVGWHFF